MGPEALARALLTRVQGSRWKWGLAAFPLLYFAWPYVYVLAMVVYNYAWWVVFWPYVSLASPGEGRGRHAHGVHGGARQACITTVCVSTRAWVGGGERRSPSHRH
jgi:hypothetical protein